MNMGIDRLSLYSSHYYIDLKTLARERGVNADKFHLGIGQERMAVPAPDEDVVSLGANAAWPLMNAGELDEVEILLFATESGIDQSKSAGIYAHRLLGMPPRCRTVELKQACYSGTAGVQMALGFVARNPGKKVLVINSDIARYDLNSPGEATQGCGAAALLISADPRLVVLDEAAGFFTEDVMDFWRPNYRTEALVDGKYSTLVYVRVLAECWAQYSDKTGLSLKDFDHFCYHIPFTKMAEKAHRKLCRKLGVPIHADELHRLFGDSLIYSRIMGNCYTGAMYVGLASLLENHAGALDGCRIGFFSYGSGCVGEFFGARVQENYRAHLFAEEHRRLLAGRSELTYQQYEDMFHCNVPTDGGDYAFPKYKTGPFRLSGIRGHKREYEAVVQ